MLLMSCGFYSFKTDRQTSQKEAESIYDSKESFPLPKCQIGLMNLFCLEFQICRNLETCLKDLENFHSA